MMMLFPAPGGPLNDREAADIARLFEIKIERPQIESCANSIIDFWRINRSSCAPGFLFLNGKSGTGKSLVLERAISEIKRLSGDGGGRLVAYFELPERCSRKDFMSCCLEAVGDPAAHIGTRTAMAQRFRKTVEKMGTEILIVDEFGHIVSRDNSEVNFTTADLLKLTIEYFRKGVVLAGLPESIRVIQSNPQLARRMQSRLELRPFALESEQALAECQSALRDYDERLIFPDYCMLADPEQMAAHVEASDGIPGVLWQLTCYAGSCAIREGTRRIEVEHWQRAWGSLRAGIARSKRNPYADLSLSRSVTKPRRS